MYFIAIYNKIEIKEMTQTQAYFSLNPGGELGCSWKKGASWKTSCMGNFVFLAGKSGLAASLPWGLQNLTEMHAPKIQSTSQTLIIIQMNDNPTTFSLYSIVLYCNIHQD